MTPSPRTRYELSSLERALDLLGVLSSQPGMRLTQLSESLDAHQTTVLRCLRVLERHEFVRRSGHGGYYLGSRIMELGQASLASIDITQELRSLTVPLSRQFAATVHVGMVSGGSVTIIDKVDPLETVVRYSTLGSRMPLHATAAGKAALALDPAELERVKVGPPLLAYTPSTIVDINQLCDEIDRVRRTHFAIERNEFHVGFGCVAVAFRIADDLYSLSVSGSIVDNATVTARGELLRGLLADFLAPYGGAAIQL
ncbi:MAG: helix-turn-helix domain-containing protein [Propionibacteriaceae bacterium]|nr:helix-turn-helix domain-containing protein [Propionibacteriaceae bacterium]